MSKKERQNIILKVISENDIETQHHLIDELTKIGLTTTQATLSRDIRELQLIKEMTPSGNYKYVMNIKQSAKNNTTKLKTIFKESVTSYAHAANIVVVKTLPGLASAACSALDSMGIENLVGSIAGDDTGFLAMTDTESAIKFCKEIKGMLE